MNRIACQVPFCRRTVRADAIAPDNEWICAKHWSRVSPATRRLYAFLRRKLRRDPANARVLRLVARTWGRAKRQAIERTGGIG